MNQIIKPFENPDMFDFEHSVQELAYKINEVIERLDWLLEVTACNFKDGHCIIHDSPKIYVEDGRLRPQVPTDYCGVAEAKMRARIEQTQKE